MARHYIWFLGTFVFAGQGLFLAWMMRAWLPLPSFPSRRWYARNAVVGMIGYEALYPLLNTYVGLFGLRESLIAWLLSPRPMFLTGFGMMAAATLVTPILPRGRGTQRLYKPGT